MTPTQQNQYHSHIFSSFSFTQGRSKKLNRGHQTPIYGSLTAICQNVALTQANSQAIFHLNTCLTIIHTNKNQSTTKLHR